MGGKRAATGLLPWHDDLAAIGGEHANGGLVKFGEGDVGDTAGEKSYPRAARPDWSRCRAKSAEEKVIIDAREKVVAFREAEELEQADATRNGLHAGTLIDPEEARRVFDEMGSGEKFLKKEITCSARKPGALIGPFDACPRMLHELAVFDAGGASRFASAAVETFVDVVDKDIVDARFPL